MAGDAAFLFYFQQDDVLVAVQSNVPDDLLVPRGFPFAPELAPGARPVYGVAFFGGQPERLAVHPGHHQDVAGVGVLGDGRNQAVLCPANGIQPVRGLDVIRAILHFCES